MRILLCPTGISLCKFHLFSFWVMSKTKPKWLSWKYSVTIEKDISLTPNRYWRTIGKIVDRECWSLSSQTCTWYLYHIKVEDYLRSIKHGWIVSCFNLQFLHQTQLLALSFYKWTESGGACTPYLCFIDVSMPNIIMKHTIMRSNLLENNYATKRIIKRNGKNNYKQDTKFYVVRLKVEFELFDVGDKSV